jgi:hypothetical protein
MKNVIITIILLIFNLSTQAQVNHHKSFSSETKRGSIIFSAGILFSVIGVTTPTETTYVNGNVRTGGTTIQTPLYNQPAKLAAITTGITLTITGIITMIYERQR